MGRKLQEVARAKMSTAGGLDGWAWTPSSMVLWVGHPLWGSAPRSVLPVGFTGCGPLFGWVTCVTGCLRQSFVFGNGLSSVEARFFHCSGCLGGIVSGGW